RPRGRSHQKCRAYLKELESRRLAGPRRPDQRFHELTILSAVTLPAVEKRERPSGFCACLSVAGVPIQLHHCRCEISLITRNEESNKRRIEVMLVDPC